MRVLVTNFKLIRESLRIRRYQLRKPSYLVSIFWRLLAGLKTYTLTFFFDLLESKLHSRKDQKSEIRVFVTNFELIWESLKICGHQQRKSSTSFWRTAAGINNQTLTYSFDLQEPKQHCRKDQKSETRALTSNFEFTLDSLKIRRGQLRKPCYLVAFFGDWQLDSKLRPKHTCLILRNPNGIPTQIKNLKSVFASKFEFYRKFLIRRDELREPSYLVPIF